MKLNKKNSLLLAPLALSAFLVGCSDAKMENETLALVDGEPILYTDLADDLMATYGTETLGMMISNQIIEKEAEKLKLSVPQERLDEEMDAYITYYGGEESFQATLDSYNMTKETLEAELKTSILTEMVVAEGIEVKEEDLKAYFEENKAQYSNEEQVAAKHILVEDEKLANEIIAKLESGSDWDELAAEHSIDEANKDQGGDLGFFGKGQMVEAFETAAFALEKDEISSPIKTEFGYHIITTYDKKEVVVATFENSKDAVKEDYLGVKASESYPTWIEDKMTEYKVENHLSSVLSKKEEK